jgi:hypothetical protein
VPDGRNRRRLALVVVGVLALHVWLLAGAPRFIVPEKSGATWTARTLAPAQAPVAEAAVAAPAPARAARPPSQVTGKPDGTVTRAGVIANASEEPKPAAQTSSAVAAPQPEEPDVASASTVARQATHVAGAAPALRFSVPASAHFNYDVIAYTKGITLNGSARLDWRNDGREYEAQLTLSAPFLRIRTQRSTGLVTPQGLAPLRFSDKVRSEEATHFDRDNGKVVFSTNKPEVPLEPGIQDRLSIVLQLGAMIAGEPRRYPAGSQITVQTASTKEAEPWTFSVDGAEMLALPGGKVQALRLTRAPRKEHDVKVELWLAPGSAYAPVRLRLTQPNGDWVDQQWSSTDRG